MKKILLLAFMAFYAINAINAIVVKRFYLKNGSILYGYLEKQDTLGNYLIRTDRAIRSFVDAKYATKQDSIDGAVFFNDFSKSQHFVPDSLINDNWRKWAEENDAFVTTKEGNKGLLLHNVMIDGNSYGAPVRLIEDGAKVKFLEIKESLYNVKWEFISSIKGDPRNDDALSGINCIFQSATYGNVEGQFAEETDYSIGLYVDGIIKSFDINDVKRITFRAINESQDILEQTPLLETITYKVNEETTSVTGIIMEQYYGGSNESNRYIKIRDCENNIHHISFDSYISTERHINKNYKPKFDVAIEKNQVIVNGEKTKRIKLHELEERLIIDSLSNSINIKQTAENIKVEYNSSDYAGFEVFQLVNVQKNTSKKNKVSYYISYKSLASSECRPINVEKKPKSSIATYRRPINPGLYALYDSNKKEAIIINITNDSTNTETESSSTSSK